MGRMWSRAFGPRIAAGRVARAFILILALGAFAAALALSAGGFSPAEAACVGPSGGVETCTGSGMSSAVFTAPGVTTLDVNTLAVDLNRISLTGSGSAPAAAPEVQHYTCSSGAANCTITAGTDTTAETCAVKDGAPAGTTCVAPPVKAAGGPSGNVGPTLVVNYDQPGASAGVANSGAVIASGTTGVLGQSNGSRGGNGSNGYVFSNGGDGHNGADGGVVTVNVNGAVQTTGDHAAGIASTSVGGDGGNGGDAKGISGNAGDGGLGGIGGTANANLNGGKVETFGDYSVGVAAVSQGGHGGNGGGGGGLVFNPGGGSAAGGGGNANVFTAAGTTIVTHGIYSHGIVAQSIGGGGGGSAGGFGLFSSSGGNGGNGGNGGVVQVINNAAITTWGDNSQGILAQTIGGGGGDGGSNFGLFASGGSGSLGGNGGPAGVVTVGITNSGAIATHGDASNGILAQSIGGGGGNGGNSGGLVALGGSGSSTTNGGIVEVTNTSAGSISTDGRDSAGIFAQSIGGGGGNGGTAGGLFTAGGKGGAGGNGARVTVTNAGDIETGKDGAGAVNSAGIFAQSIGGGGGNGGGSFSGGIGFSVALGGAGGPGGSAGDVQVLRDEDDTAYSIITHGDQSDAVFAQSIGGGGGNGGFAVSAAVGALALGMGGTAGDGGPGGAVTVETAGSLTTYGDGSRGIFAQSLGGGGGNGGAAIAVAVNATGTFAAAIGIGGNGGKGGNASTVNVSSLSDISTAGDNAAGIVAQSVGGGGGNGGYSIGGAIGGIGLAVTIGGSGTSGGSGAGVTVDSSGSIHTVGENSTGILAQSIGGGGGNGGFTASAVLAAGGASVGLGGSGAAGSGAGDVVVNADGAGHAVTTTYAGTWNLVTEGDNAVGIQAESVGGGGGNGGFSGSLTATGLASIGVNLGGKAGGGGDAGKATVNNGRKSGDVVIENNILTLGDGSTGILAQSIGGGGGNGGFAVTLSASGSFEGVGGAAAVSVGGKGGAGGVGKDVTVTSYGNIATYGKQADGILAQSIGGGGGNGGFSVSGTFTSGALGASVAVGGAGGTGQNGGIVTVRSTGDIETHGDQSAGILAQSVGGGGGNGGFAGAGTITLQGGAAAIGLGGNGAGGGNGLEVGVTSTGNITTYGDQSVGILAQSVGGGGGNGGSTVSLALGLDGGVGVALGGKGGAGGTGGTVTVNSTGDISTGAGFDPDDPSSVRGTGAAGILAQSVGGGGGNGGFSGTLGGGMSIAAGVALGGEGAGGGNAGTAGVTSYGNIFTSFDNSSGIIAQSVGGGGGNGGFSVAVAGALGDPDAATGAVAIGGKGGVGGTGNDVTVTSTGTIVTSGKFSNGILAQSIGGGGGNGGFAVSGSATTGNAGIGVGVGGNGAAGSTAGDVTVHSYGVGADGAPVEEAPPADTLTIWTSGDNSSGIFAQSVGGGGGSGGFAGSLGIGLGGGGLGVSVGGGAGSGSDAGTVDVTSYNNILTEGKDSFGILAQSVGGGGGDGGFAIALSGGENLAGSVAVGGSGSSGGDGAAVSVDSHGDIETDGDGSHAIFAQSVGGGGGNGGFAVSGALAGSGSLSVGLGGKGGAGGDAKTVTVTSTGDLRTEGQKADGILAQSVGGGGGNGGFTGSLAITANGGAIGAGVGGSGGDGGNGDEVGVTSNGDIVTLGNGSNGILAQSVGGGGGNGGASVALSGAGRQASAAVSVGGSGGDGGTSGRVTVDHTGTIDTAGDEANGILAQSVAGGGGVGGFSIAGNMTVDGAGGASVSIGGGGGTGQDAGAVVVNSNAGTTLTGNAATIHTAGGDANGIFAQSVGGGGGAGGFSGALSVTGPGAKAAVGVSIGGFGDGGGNGSTVNVTSVDNILTEGDGSNGILAQSVGGGGGNGGFSFAAAVNGTLGKSEGTKGAISASLGGFGGAAGDGADVGVDSTGIIETTGSKAFGVLAQSVGGGGGNGGLSVTTSLSLGENGNQISASVGGTGGSGGAGGDVEVTRNGATITTGDNSVGIFAQSIGGGGGNGGLAVSGVIAGTDAKTLSATLGGFGGEGSQSGKVTVDNTGAVTTGGVEAHAIQAQSIGGGGGNGGMAVSAAVGSLGTGTNLNVGVSVGGLGGSGGYAGDVEVTNHGLLTTEGDGAVGIFAQSIGGGGGAGGNAITGLLGVNGNNEGTQANISVAVGGAGGDGNTGGAVTIDQSGGIETSGVGAFGILAQSIGGGGGTGGRANSISLQLGAKCTLPGVCESAGGKPGWNLQATVGGTGGSANDADTVEVTNHDFITTHGDKSSGIVAQSIGGGGGIGGDAYVGTGGLFDIPYVPIDPTLLLKPLGTASLTRSGAVGIGGSGGAAGDGGTVIVVNEGVITTEGSKSDGIHAQSIGGGGGDGGDGEAGALGTVGLGGSGGASGDGGTVSVTNGKADLSQAGIATIETFGGTPTAPGEDDPSADPEEGHSAGIFAQSVGGGGGTGGGAGGLISVGGSGGASGSGGHVTVDNYGGILTHADDSVGIFAQSVGGGGGAGGSLGISAVAVGGSAGSSGDGGEVDVTNAAMIETHGIDAYAIQAQSVGGGGGAGGGKNGGVTGSIPALIAIGGNGSGGGAGGVVTVTNSNSLHTYGAGADGINAQSVGGGGGTGGRSIGFIAVGGKGGSSGDGGAVDVTNTEDGTITVEGYGAHGIFAQSVGGGGGTGGGAFATSIVPVSIGVGGDGGSSGDGGTVDVENSGSITTVADASVGIFAESVGGGGGNGGMSVAAALSGAGSFTFGIGGAGGANGDGGDVTVTNHATGIIHTEGYGSTGIMAQSVGGGGGNGGAAYAAAAGGTPSIAIALGGAGAAGGDGGTVIVTNEGAMQLDGDNSVAIFAQSVGGGGGSGGAAIAVPLGAPAFIGGSDGATGKGGDVTVTNTGTITLTGDGSVGIFAQSVGGGGGVVTAGTDGIIEATSGGTGNGGAVTVDSNVAMVITGDNSVGVFGQSVGGGGGVGGFAGNYLGLEETPESSSLAFSTLAVPEPEGFMGTAGGAGTGGDIDITQTADLFVTGNNSFAILQQSAGGSGNGNIKVTIAEGVTIVGGSGAGAGVGFKDGNDNELANYGIVSSVLGIDGYAMRAGEGNDTFDNYYAAVGSVGLGGGVNAFNNAFDAIYLMGDTVDLGEKGQFSNAGYIAPGGIDRVLTTDVTGSWSQSDTGTYWLDLDLDPEADRINVTGTASVDGIVDINIMHPEAAKPGNVDYVILHADGGVTDEGLALNYVPSAVTRYALEYPNPDDVVLNVDIDFARPELTDNQRSVGSAINAIQTDLTSPDFEKIARAIFYVPTLGELGQVYDSISGEGVSGFQQPEFDMSSGFMSAMFGQADNWRIGLATDPLSRSISPRTSAYADAKKAPDPIGSALIAQDERRWKVWTTLGGNSGDVSGNASVGSADTSYSGGSLAGGVDYQLDPDTLLGFALGGGTASFSVPDRATHGDITGGHVGLYGAHKWGQFYANGAVSFDMYDNSTRRSAAIPGSDAPLNPVQGYADELEGDFTSRGFSARFETGWRREFEGFGAVTGFAGVQFAALAMDGFTETTPGENVLGLSFEDRTVTSLPTTLGLQFDTLLDLGGDASIQPWVRAAWLHEFEPDRSVEASFVAAPGYPFVVQGAAASEDAVAVNAGVKVNINDRAAFFATFDGKFGDTLETYAGNAGLLMRW